MKLSIIIVNYNVKFFLEQCLCSVNAAIEFIDSEVIVIDNCSTDNSVGYLQKKFDWVKFISNETNEGFGKANNKALQHCSGDIILFLNPDTILPENILQNCLDFFSATTEAAAAGVKMIDGSGNFLPESKRAFPSPMVSFFKLCGLADVFPKSKLFNKYALGFLAEEETHEVDVLCGAFLMAKRNILEQIAGFDEAFFMYGEDIDLCYRIKNTGSKIYYLGTETIVHFKGESARKGDLNYVRMFYTAMQVFVKKHYAGGYAVLMVLFLQVAILLRAGLSFTAAIFRKLSKKISASSGETNEHLLLVGDDVSVKEAQQIILNTKPDMVAGYTAVTGLLKLKSLLKGKIIFCTGRLSYTQCIGFMNEEKERFSYKWHGLNSGSIVGSSNKKITGVAESLED